MKLNADLGEEQTYKGKNVAFALAPHIHLANISCNAHAGTKDHIIETIDICLENNIQLGAHPSYEDRDNFGRTSIELSFSDIKELIQRQYEWLNEVVESRGGNLQHVKPHGALYNDMMRSRPLLKTIFESIGEISEDLKLIGQYSPLGFEVPVFEEVFIDRLYNEESRLVSRKENGAVFDNFEDIKAQLLSILSKEKIKTNSDKKILLSGQTICIHGDNKVLIENIEEISRLINEI
ncbi:MAG: LamB/YcsF family protein [Bacteriovoracaceae bacterium]|nr:LamB/YcsF family protein [Bacteriovoracaceae bacterium]